MYSRELMIANTLRDLGIAAHLDGYWYLREAVAISIQGSLTTKISTMYLYERIALDHDTTVRCVERACRYAMREGWLYRDAEVAHSIFGNNEDVPTTGKFIRIVANRLRVLEEAEHGT